MTALEVPQSRRRLPVIAAGALAGVLLAVALVLNYQYETRDEFNSYPVPWAELRISEDRRTATFTGEFRQDCDEPDRVELAGQNPMRATVYYRRPTIRDGQPVLCSLAAYVPGLEVSVTLIEPLPAGTLFVDGAKGATPSPYR